MMMDERKLEFRTGLAVVIGLIILAGLIVFSGGLQFLRDYYLIKVRFDSAAGLKKGAPVRMAGVEIGKVEDIAFKVAPNRKTYIEMVLQVERGYQINTDSEVAITSDSLLGERFLEITPGVTKAYLAPGETLPKKGTTPKSLDEALKMVPPIVDSFKSAIDNVNKIISDPKFQNDFRKTVENLSNASANADSLLSDLRSVIGENRENLRVTLENAARTSRSVAEFAERLQEIRKEAEETIALFRDEFRSFTARINDPKRFKKIDEALDKFAKLPDRLNGLIDSLRKLSDTDAAKVISKAEKVAEELRLTILQARRDMEEILASIKCTVELTRTGDGIVAALLTDRTLKEKFNDMVDQGIFLLEHPIMFILKGGYKKRREPPAEWNGEKDEKEKKEEPSGSKKPEIDRPAAGKER